MHFNLLHLKARVLITILSLQRDEKADLPVDSTSPISSERPAYEINLEGGDGQERKLSDDWFQVQVLYTWPETVVSSPR